MDESMSDVTNTVPSDVLDSYSHERIYIAQDIISERGIKKVVVLQAKSSSDTDEGLSHLSNMVAVLSEQRLFLPLLRAFEMFLPSCSLLPFIRSLQVLHRGKSLTNHLLMSYSVLIVEVCAFMGLL